MGSHHSSDGQGSKRLTLHPYITVREYEADPIPCRKDVLRTTLRGEIDKHAFARVDPLHFPRLAILIGACDDGRGTLQNDLAFLPKRRQQKVTNGNGWCAACGVEGLSSVHVRSQDAADPCMCLHIGSSRWHSVWKRNSIKRNSIGQGRAANEATHSPPRRTPAAPPTGVSARRRPAPSSVVASRLAA